LKTRNVNDDYKMTKRDYIRKAIDAKPKLKRFLHYMVMNQIQTRPRWYVRLLAPLYQHRGKHSKIYASVRMDTPPYHRFSLGDYSVVESFSCVNNAMGDVLIGAHTRIGLGNTIIGPVTIGDNVNLAQKVVITALNHNFSDSEEYISEQGVNVAAVNIGDDVWIGAGVVVLPGVVIGSHSVVAAGAVVTKDVASHTVVGGVPASVLKRI
jgi:acetyltransferase-like isoleucine patch superfamily enzyme